MLNIRRLIVVMSALLVVAACSGDKPPESVLKTQTDALHKAEDVNTMVEDAAATQRQAIDDQSH